MQTQFLQRPGGRIAFDDNGDGDELVIMVPGVGALRSEYRFLTPTLQEAGYRAVTADLRGHGESDATFKEYTIKASAEDILALIEHLDAGPAHVIGTSFSPGAAVYAAAEQPEAIRSLVLISPFVREAQMAWWQKLALGVMFAGPWKVSAWTMYYKSLYPSGLPDGYDEYIAQLKETLHQPGKFAAFETLSSCSRDDSEKRLDQVRAPVQVIMGTADPDWPDPTAEGRWIAAQLNAELILIDGAGHYPQTEMPEVTNPQIIDFLRQTSASQVGEEEHAPSVVG